MKDYQTLLAFTDQWLRLGVLTEDILRQCGVEYEASGDRNTEHYRYGVFLRYLREHRPLSAAEADALYELGASDPDLMTGGCMMADVVELPECPAFVSEKALASDRKHLVRLVKRWALLEALRQDILSQELFERCLASCDSVVHRALVEQVEISREQMQVLAEQGVNRAIRNMAADRMRQKIP